MLFVESGKENISAPTPRRIIRNTPTEVRIARGFDELLMVYSIRAAVYMAELDCPFAEEFDGNDLCATQFIALFGDEPAGCLRARFFAGFVKLERLAIRKPYRRSTIAFDHVSFGIDYARRKGFQRIYGHARKGLEPFWARFGGKPIPGREEFVFSDHRYTEMVADFEPLSEAITLADPPMKILRPEGDWDREGILESSAARPARLASSKSVRTGRRSETAA